VPQYPLGRLKQHDERSRAFAYRAAAPAVLRSVRHTSHIGILDQGDVGSCTGNATVGALGYDPYFSTVNGTSLDEDLAVKVYSLATTLDPFTGTYLPDDTGSSGLAAAKAAQQLGLISGYQHAFNLAAALTALQAGPVITGITWYESFFTPSSSGLVNIQTGDKPAGGHEVCVDGYDDAEQLVWFRNSWSDSWGVGGRFCMPVTTWAQLLSDDGDATILTPLTLPAPVPNITPDAILIRAMDPWASGTFATYTKAGKAASAFRTWRASKGI